MTGWHEKLEGVGTRGGDRSDRTPSSVTSVNTSLESKTENRG